MGLLYERYSDPVSYLEAGFDSIGIIPTVLQVYIDKNNRDLWELYLSSKPQQSFNEWKKSLNVGTNEIYAEPESKGGTNSEEETRRIVEQSEKILNRCQPN